MGGDFWNIVQGLKPAMVMVMVQIAFAGVNVLYKLAANDGMSLRVLVAYRYLFALAFVAPLALFFERKIRPKLTWMVVFQAFLCGLFGGTLSQNLYVASLALTSATFASAMTNLVPAITFIMAISFGLERLAVRTVSGKAKVFGTVIGICGGMVLTFYKGAEINIWSTNINLTHVAESHKVSSNRALGSLLALASCLSYSIWLIIQTDMSTRYPCQYSSTALMCLMGSIQAVVFALCMERGRWDHWRLGWNIRLVTVAYSGIIASGIMLTLIAWCVRIKGPMFVSIFNPLMLILVAVAGSLILNEKLHLGWYVATIKQETKIIMDMTALCILGAVLIVGGLYVVLWGKGEEMKRLNQLTEFKTSKESRLIEVVVTDTNHNNNGNDQTKDSVNGEGYALNNTVEGDIGGSDTESEVKDCEGEVSSLSSF